MFVAAPSIKASLTLCTKAVVAKRLPSVETTGVSASGAPVNTGLSSGA